LALLQPKLSLPNKAVIVEGRIHVAEEARLLGIDPGGKKATKRSAMLDRLVAAAREMSDEELRVSTVQAEALVHARLS